MYNVHLFVGAKGGIGKTRCAISAATKFMKDLDHVDLSLLDANTNNIDLFTLLAGHGAYKKNVREMTEPFTIYGKKFFRKKKTFQKNNDPVDLQLFVREEPLSIYNGIKEFWSTVCAIVDKTNKSDLKKSDDQALIVDTNLSLFNLVSADKNENEKLIPYFKRIKDVVNHIYIWYVWTYNDFLEVRNEQIAKLGTKLDALQKISYGVFDSKKTLIHVLNPHIFFDFGKKNNLFKVMTFLKNDKFIKTAVEKLASHDLTTHLSVDAIFFLFNSILSELIKKDDNLEITDEVYKTLEREITKINKSSNFLLLPNSSENKNYIDQKLSSSNHKKIVNVEELNVSNFGKSDIWEVLQHINDFVN